MLDIVIQEVLWSIRGSYSAQLSIPLTNVRWYSDPWPVTVTSQPIRLSSNFMTLIPGLTFIEIRVVSMEHLQRVWLASRERLPSPTPGSFPLFGDLRMLQLLRLVLPKLPYLLFRYEATRIWNSLPNEIRKADSYKAFQRLLQVWEGPLCNCSACCT